MSSSKNSVHPTITMLDQVALDLHYIHPHLQKLLKSEKLRAGAQKAFDRMKEPNMLPHYIPPASKTKTGAPPLSVDFILPSRCSPTSPKFPVTLGCSPPSKQSIFPKILSATSLISNPMIAPNSLSNPTLLKECDVWSRSPNMLKSLTV
ncbi:hypothetical protein L218DRAFT_627522 [Marasmius fiardii PR-910]|nr:hypothetical protein L218DRAFT_627522 [Marasmius fiardii PR-910]